MKPTILLGVTGGIAAVKVPDLIQALTNFCEIKIILTKSAQNIVTIKDYPMYTELFPNSFDPATILKKRQVEHIDLADSADLFVIVPATANVIAKLAHGIADDYLTTTALAVTCPILVCPSMNVHMWKHPATQNNISKLTSLGYHILGPDAGMLACGYEGEGRLIDTGELARCIRNFSAVSKPLQGKKVLVTAGGTIEPIDDVRVITNKSSGKMGVALAGAAKLAGADVLLLRSTTSVAPRLAMKEILFDTADSLEKLMETYCPDFDICIHSAAVSDFRIHKRRGKTSSDAPLALELEPRSKILEKIKSFHPGIFLVAFKAESNVSDEELILLAKKRLTQARADLIVANDIHRNGLGFQSDENEVFLISKQGTVIHFPKQPKSIIAEKIIEQCLME